MRNISTAKKKMRKAVSSALHLFASAHTYRLHPLCLGFIQLGVVALRAQNAGKNISVVAIRFDESGTILDVVPPLLPKGKSLSPSMEAATARIQLALEHQKQSIKDEANAAAGQQGSAGSQAIENEGNGNEEVGNVDVELGNLRVVSTAEFRLAVKIEWGEFADCPCLLFPHSPTSLQHLVPACTTCLQVERGHFNVTPRESAHQDFLLKCGLRRGAREPLPR